MARQYDQNGYAAAVSIDRSKLSLFTLFLGWLGSHRFYLGSDLLGAIYFTVTVLGLVFTLYYPIWVTVYGFNINTAVLILLSPLVISIIEFFTMRRYTDGELYHRYRPPGEPLTLVLVSQFIYLILLVIPAI